MITRTHLMLRTLVGASMVVLAATSVATAQVQPNPPSPVLLDGVGSTGTPLFLDDFNYIVDRSWTTTGQAGRQFSAAGWGYSKCINGCDNNNGPAAYIFTTTTIPGYTGRMPGRSGSGRVLAFEARPTSIALVESNVNQTDFYLQYGRANSTAIPANVWYQFWFFIADTATQRSRFSDGNKLIYPSPNGTYSVPNGQVPYMVLLTKSSLETTGVPANILGYDNASLYITNTPQNVGTYGGDFQRASEYPTNKDDLGTNLNRNTGFMVANRWYLIKIHIDHSGPQGKYEQWMRPLGGSWEKTSEWIGGVTPNFFWTTHPEQRAGISTIRVPSTWGKANTTPTNYDSWTYMADFTIATGEAALPVYTGY